MLHNGAEYHGNYDCSFDDLVGFHNRRIAVLARTNADFLAFESIPSLEEARAILAALQPYPDVAAYLSFTCRDGMHVSHGETLRACAELLDTQPQVIGIGVNCTAPELITSLIGELAKVTSKPIIVYPNSGEQWDACIAAGKGTDRSKRLANWQGVGGAPAHNGLGAVAAPARNTCVPWLKFGEADLVLPNRSLPLSFSACES